MEKAERCRRMKRCASEVFNFQEILDEYSWLIIEDIHKTSNLPMSYLFLSVAVAMSHWANGATIEGINFYKIPLILFGILCGGSGR